VSGDLAPRLRSRNAIEAIAPGRRPLLYACFVASGAAGLILEVVWSKYFSLLLGNSTHGVSTVVAAFLGGLGIGAYLGGRLAARTREPLVAYARLELIVAVLGLASPLAYLAAKPLFASLYGLFGAESNLLFFSLRFLTLFAALLLPTIAMGATLPLLASDFTRRGAAFGAEVGRLYAFNTAGAVAGVAASGFLLIPLLGLWKTAALASLLDFGVVVAVLLWRPAAPPAAEPRPEPPAESAWMPAPAGGGLLQTLIVPLFAVSGFTAILYQIAWTRVLSVPLGGMVYALSAILAVYLLGLALGSAAASRLLKGGWAPALLFGVLQLLLAASVIGGGHLFGEIPAMQGALIGAAMGKPALFFAGEAAIAAVFVMVPTLILGALFPTAAAIYQGGRQEAGASVGAIYAANTVGSIAGSLVTGFVLIPKIGSLQAIVLAAGMNTVIGIMALLFGEGAPRPRFARAALATAVALVIAIAGRPVWQPEKMTLGITQLLREYWLKGDRGIRDLIAWSGTPEAREKTLFYREGRLASVAVVRSGTDRIVMLLNGKPDAMIGTGGDMLQQVLLGHVPLLLAREKREICIVGYGSGVSTHAVLTHPVESALTIELEAAVIEAAPYFSEGAFDPLLDPRSSCIIEDAGTFLRSSARRFDVIINEPTNPWVAGVGDLFTREFYDQAAARLLPGGVLCQWMQCYEISRSTLNTIFRTLARRFPHGHLFYCWQSMDLIIVASASGEIVLDLERMQEALERPQVAKDLERVGVIGVIDLLRFYRGRLETVVRAAGDGPVNTDDNGWLEHRAPLDLVRPEPMGEPIPWSEAVADDLARSIGACSDGAAALLLAAVGRALEVSAQLEALGQKSRAAGNVAAALGLVATLEKLGRPEAAAARGKIAQQIVRESAAALDGFIKAPAPELAAELRARFAEAVRLDPENGEAHWGLAKVQVLSGESADAVASFRRAIQLLPEERRFLAHNDLALAYFQQGELAASLKELDELDRLRPGSVEARCGRTHVLAAQGDLERAWRELESGLREHPRDARLLEVQKVLEGMSAPRRAQAPN
jgi:spermidine synthase